MKITLFSSFNSLTFCFKLSSSLPVPRIKNLAFSFFSFRRILAASINVSCPLTFSSLASIPTTYSSSFIPYFSFNAFLSSSDVSCIFSTPFNITSILSSLTPPSVRFSFAASATAIILSDNNSFMFLYINLPRPFFILGFTGNTECLVKTTLVSFTNFAASLAVLLA